MDRELLGLALESSASGLPSEETLTSANGPADWIHSIMKNACDTAVPKLKVRDDAGLLMEGHNGFEADMHQPKRVLTCSRRRDPPDVVDANRAVYISWQGKIFA